MEKYKLIKIFIDDIDFGDLSFKISDDVNNDKLELSINEFGLLSPPILLKNENKYTIISGFKRVLLFKNAGNIYINALVFETNDLRFCYKFAIIDNSSHRPLSFNELIKCIRLIKKYSVIDFDSDNYLKKISILLNIDYNIDYLNKIIKIANLSDNIINLIDKDRLSFSNAYELTKFNQKTIILYGIIFSVINISFSNQKELLNLINEISLIENICHDVLLNEIISLLNNNLKQSDNNIKYLSISKILNQRRYPFTAEYKGMIDNKVRNLNSDKFNKIIICNNYENLKYQIPISFKNISEFDDQCKRINDLKTNKDFIALFDF